MPLNETEKTLLEAISSLLKQDAKLGLPVSNETSHTSQFRWEGIDDAFALKIANSSFADSIKSAFFAVHSHKYIDNPIFKLSFEKEMTARAIPTTERKQALKYLEEMTNELSSNKLSEQDAGWNPALDEIVDMTTNADSRTSKTSKPFTGGGPAPEGDRGGKGGIYMEDSFNYDDWSVKYSITGDEPQIILLEAKKSGNLISGHNEILQSLNLTQDDVYRLAAQ